MEKLDQGSVIFLLNNIFYFEFITCCLDGNTATGKSTAISI